MADVIVFPHSRNVGMVDRIARQMAARASMDEAEQELIVILEIVWDRLELFGVDCDEIDLECNLLARAAWGRWQELQREGCAA